MSYSYDYLQARVADYYSEADNQRALAGARNGRGRRWSAFARRRRRQRALGGRGS